MHAKQVIVIWIISTSGSFVLWFIMLDKCFAVRPAMCYTLLICCKRWERMLQMTLN